MNDRATRLCYNERKDIEIEKEHNFHFSFSLNKNTDWTNFFKFYLICIVLNPSINYNRLLHNIVSSLLSLLNSINGHAFLFSSFCS